jgi:membrane-bound metal-dependent hydrolase YbcI (DUF457 family)
MIMTQYDTELAISVMLLRKQKVQNRQLLPSLSISMTGFLALLIWNNWVPTRTSATLTPAITSIPTVTSVTSPAVTPVIPIVTPVIPVIPVATSTPAITQAPTIVTIKAKVTFYNPMDPRCVEVDAWRDGLVAWYKDGKPRSVKDHPYGIATDWQQFPPSTRISVPGYRIGSFITVDDGCGAARRARRHWRQPIIDLRFPSDSHWGRQYLEIDVIFPSGFTIPSSLTKWIVKK